MDLNKFTQKSQEAILGAQRLAEELNHQTIEPAHLLLALLIQEDGVAPAIVMKVAGGVQALREDVRRDLEGRPKVYGAGGGGPVAAGERCLGLRSATLRVCRTIMSRRSTSCWG